MKYPGTSDATTTTRHPASRTSTTRSWSAVARTPVPKFFDEPAISTKPTPGAGYDAVTDVAPNPQPPSNSSTRAVLSTTGTKVPLDERARRGDAVPAVRRPSFELWSYDFA